MSTDALSTEQFKDHPYKSVIGMVPTSTLYRYREYDRPVAPGLADDVRRHGIKDPLILTYSQSTGEAMLGEGNHRLAVARSLGISHLPARVWRVSGPIRGNGPGSRGGTPVPTRPAGNQHGYVPADLHPRSLGL